MRNNSIMEQIVLFHCIYSHLNIEGFSQCVWHKGFMNSGKGTMVKDEVMMMMTT